jgi:hypothetical protein
MKRIKKDGAEDAEAEMRYTYIFGTSHALGKRDLRSAHWLFPLQRV